MEKCTKSKFTKKKFYIYLIILVTIYISLGLSNDSPKNIISNRSSFNNKKNDDQKNVFSNSVKRNKNSSTLNNKQLIFNSPTLNISDINTAVDVKITFKKLQDRLKELIPLTTTEETDFNQMPIAIAGPSITIKLNELAILDGSQSYDPDQEELMFNWTLIDAPDGSNVDMSINKSPFLSLKLNLTGIYHFNLIVSDGELNSLPSRVEVEVEDDNNLPIAIISAPKSIQPNTDFTLSGTQSYDPSHENIIEYKWTQINGPINFSNNMLASSDPDLILNLNEKGTYNFSLSVFNGRLWSNQSYKSITVKDPNDLEIKIKGNVYLTTESSNEYLLESQPELDASHKVKWYFSYIPEDSQSEIIPHDTTKSSFTPDKKGIYILKAVVLNSEGVELGTGSLSIASNPNFLKQQVLQPSKINNDQGKVFISAGPNENYCNNTPQSIKLNGTHGGLSSNNYVENWKLLTQPKNSNAKLIHTPNNEFILNTDKTLGEYKLKYEIKNEKGDFLEDYKTIKILSKKLGFNMPKTTGLPQDIIQISDPQDYGFKVLYGPHKKLFSRVNTKKRHYYLRIDGLKKNITYKIISTDASILELNDKTKIKNKKNSKLKKDIRIYNSWTITAPSNLTYHLYIEDIDTYKNHGGVENTKLFITEANSEKYKTLEYKKETIPFFDDEQINDEVVSELIPPGGSLYFQKIDFKYNKAYYYNARVFHSKWQGVFGEEDELYTFKIIKIKVENTDCYDIQLL